MNFCARTRKNTLKCINSFHDVSKLEKKPRFKTKLTQQFAKNIHFLVYIHVC